MHVAPTKPCGQPVTTPTTLFNGSDSAPFCFQLLNIPLKSMTHVVVLLCLCLCVYEAKAYKNGFKEDACKTLCPIGDCTDNRAGDAAEVELEKSERGFPLSSGFVFDNKIRRTTPFRVNMTAPRGLHVNALMMVFREHHGTGEPLGSFKSFSENLKPVECTSGSPNALTNKDFSEKTTFWFEWMPSDIPDTNIALRGTFVMEDEYWSNIEVKGTFMVDTFPPSMSECDKTKSCVTVSSSAEKCYRTSRCDVTLQYGLSSDGRTLDVVLGGVASQTGQYVAVAFTDDHVTMKDARVFSCRRTKDAAAVQHFVLDTNGGSPQEKKAVLEREETEQDGDHVWCSFSTPVVVAGYNLTTPLYQVYLHGNADMTSGLIEIGPRYRASKKKIEIGVPFESKLTSGALSLYPLASMLTLQLCLWLLQTH